MMYFLNSNEKGLSIKNKWWNALKKIKRLKIHQIKKNKKSKQAIH